MKKFLLAGVAFGALVAGPAMGADLARPVYRAPVALVPVGYNWTGFYVGGHFGGGWGRNAFSERSCGGGTSEIPVVGDEGDTIPVDFVCGPVNAGENLQTLVSTGQDVGSHQFAGGLGGLQVGYNWQIGRVLIGVEGQFSWSDLKGDHQNTTSDSFITPEGDEAILTQGTHSDRFYSKVKQIGTIAARLGLVSGPEGRTLAYLKGGVGYAKTDFTLLQQFSASLTPADGDRFEPGSTVSGTGTLNGSSTRWGPMAGIGLEFVLFDNWTAKVEYDRLFLRSKDVTLTGSQAILFSNSDQTSTTGVGGTRTFSVDQNINIVKFGLNYRFGNYYTPVVTK